MRHPAVADRFYPGSPAALSQTIAELAPANATITPTKAYAVVAPHAGYIYSGALAAKTFSRVEIPETVIILGPNHHGRGAPVSLSTEIWDMPFGQVPADIKFAQGLLAASAYIKIDETAHQLEHSLEVQVPFLQLRQKNLHLAPLVIGHLSYPLCEEIAAALASTIKGSTKDILIVASSDMSHYEPRRSSEKKDRSALACIERLDPYALYRIVHDNRISMCGVIPVVIAMLAAKACGAKKTDLVGYTDSGYTSGDTDQVVGYAGLIIH